MATKHYLLQVPSDDSVRVDQHSARPGQDITLQNIGDAYIYIGNRNVNPMSFGYRIAPDSAISFELDWRDEIYAFADTESEGSTLAVMSVGLEKLA